MREFLEPSKYIDWKSDAIIHLASELSKNKTTEEEIANSCFEFVRDQIKHSLDYKLNPVTCKASDVLKEKTGFCFAKSHLLAALLRASNIPTALMYQRIAFGENKASMSACRSPQLTKVNSFLKNIGQNLVLKLRHCWSRLQHIYPLWKICPK